MVLHYYYIIGSSSLFQLCKWYLITTTSLYSLDHCHLSDLHNCLTSHFFNFIYLMLTKNHLLQYLCFSESPRLLSLDPHIICQPFQTSYIEWVLLLELCYYQYGQAVSVVKVVVLICIIKSYTCIITIYTIKSSF